MIFTIYCDGASEEWLGHQISISFVLWIPIEPSKTVEVTNSEKLRDVEDKEIVKEIVGINTRFLSSIAMFAVKKKAFAGRLARHFL